MDRYTARNFEKNLVPEIKVSGIEFKNYKSRMPASVKTKEDNIAIENNVTNKKLYFLSLYEQFESLKKYSDKVNVPSVSICPNFHTGLTNYKEKYSKNENNNKAIKLTYKLDQIQNEGYLVAHPEFYLPLTKEAKLPRVVDIIKSNKINNEGEVNELVKKAIDLHLTKTFYEITELCENGSSDNYYIYENLITHIKTNQFAPSNENMMTLLKTTVFSNMALIKSLDNQKTNVGRSIASTNVETNALNVEIMSKMNVEWANEYFKNLKN
jgi:hypothetical protein